MGQGKGPVHGEVWADADGALMTCATGDRWWVFGAADPIPGDAATISLPLRRVFNIAGEYVLDEPLYPSGHAFRRRTSATAAKVES